MEAELPVLNTSQVTLPVLPDSESPDVPDNQVVYQITCTDTGDDDGVDTTTLTDAPVQPSAGEYQSADATLLSYSDNQRNQSNSEEGDGSANFEPEPLLQLPNGYSYLKSDRKMRCDDSWKVHINIQDAEELRNWLKTYQEISGSTWRVLKTYPKDGNKRYSFKVDYRCQHNTLPRSSTANSRRASKNCECPAKLALSLRRVDDLSAVKWVDRHLKQGYLASCTFGRSHNHPLICADSLRFRDVSEGTQLKLKKLFEAGHSPTSACEFIKSELFDSCGPDEFLVKSADRSVCPDLPYCFRFYNKMFKNPKPNNEIKAKETGLDKLKSNIRQYNQELGKECVRLAMLQDKLIVAVCTPLMQRVHELWPCSSELVFLTSSDCLDKDKHKIYALMTYSPVGGMPLGSFITTTETQNAVESGLQLLLELVEKPFNDNSAPALVVVEESVQERAAVDGVFRNRGIMICPMSVLQTVWHWLHEHREQNYADLDRASTMEVMKQVLSSLPSRNVERFSRELLSQQRGSYTLLNYIAHLYNRKDEWCLSMKPEINLKGRASRGIVQAPFKMMKENMFPKLAEYDFTQLVDYVVTSWNNGFEQRLVDVANNRYDKTLPRSKVMRSNGGISKDGVNKVTECRYHVRSNADPTLYYEVDMELALCSCEVGMIGEMCEHLQACFYYYGESMTAALPKTSSSQRLLYYKIATGSNNLPTDSWFQPLNSKSAASNNSEKSKPPTSTFESAQQIKKFHKCQFRKVQKAEVSEEAKRRLKLRINVFARHLRKLAQNSLYYGSITSFLDNVDKVSSGEPAQLGDALRMFGTAGGSGLSLNTAISSASKRNWQSKINHRLTPKSLNRPMKRGRTPEHAYSTSKKTKKTESTQQVVYTQVASEHIECVEIVPGSHSVGEGDSDPIIIENILM